MIAAHDRPDAEAAAEPLPTPTRAGGPDRLPRNVCGGGWPRERKGKGKGSRWNAVRHGCMAKALIPADLQVEVDRCTAMLTEHYRPTNAFEVTAIARMGRLGPSSSGSRR